MELAMTEEDFIKMTRLTGMIMSAIKDVYPDSMTTNPHEGGIVSNQLTLVLAIALGTQAKYFGGSEQSLALLIEEVVAKKLALHAIEMYRDLDPSSPQSIAEKLMPIGEEPSKAEVEKFLELIETLKTKKGKVN